MTKEMHISYNKFLFHIVLSALHVSNESSRSSSEGSLLYMQSIITVFIMHPRSLAANTVSLIHLDSVSSQSTWVHDKYHRLHVQ